MRDSEAVEKVRETGGSRMIIGEILCLFLLLRFPILPAPLSFSPFHDLVAQKLRKQAKRNAKDGIVCHDDRKDMGILN